MNPFIDPEFRALIPPLTPEEYAGLEKSLMDEGCRDALVIWEGLIIDGHNRFEICQREDIPFKILEKSFEDRLDVKIWIRLNQASRRNLSDDQRAMNALGLMELLSEKAKRERGRAGRAAGGDATDEQKAMRAVERLSATSSDKRSEPKLKTDTRKTVSKQTKVSERKLKTAKTVKEKNPELAEKVASGEMTLRDAEKQIKAEEREEERVKLVESIPSGKFAVICADPPWEYKNSGFDESAESQYPTMPTAEICSMFKIVNDFSTDATVLFLWATNPLLPDAIQVMAAWGFEYKTNMAWIKDRGRGKGWFLKSKHELLLIGTRPSTPHPKERPDSSFEADRPPTHSKKPNVVYSEIIPLMYDGLKIEMFAREKRDGWEAHGNQL